ncbi:alpha-L-rhamnosidase N-terminal domain-containing protein [Streptomyces sp. NPDC005811]|uniref:alpha-L-rhamnosidase N-terminal domain-containing protein n=1 Tax=Streptomyces sp. NPDC005811 TaxID=3154565 RepID=UPI0033E40E38
MGPQAPPDPPPPSRRETHAVRKPQVRCPRLRPQRPVDRPRPSHTSVVPGSRPPAPLLRRDFSLAHRPERAALHIVGLGYQVTEINGRPVSDALLDPPASQYDRTAYARTFDVTGLLHEGEKTIGVELGRSYASGVGGPEAVWASEPRPLAQLDIALPDGGRRRVVSDGSRRMADGPTRDWMFLGEHHDARAEKTGWTTPDTTTRPGDPRPNSPHPPGLWSRRTCPQ